MSDETLASLDGYVFRAKDKPGVVWLIAEVPESENYQAYKDSVRIVVGYDPNESIPTMKSLKNVNVNLNGNKLLVWSSGKAEIQVRIFDLLGKQVFGKSVSGNAAIDLGMLSNGHYIVNLVQGAGQKSIRWVKK